MPLLFQFDNLAPLEIMKDYFIAESDVVYLDNHLLVINKPPGVLAQMDKDGNRSLEDAAKDYLAHKFKKPGNVFATTTHRLDRPVGGLVIIARTSKALVRMNEIFAQRKIQKIYLAIVGGKPEQELHLRHWIKKNEVTNKVWTYTYERGDAKQADLKYWFLAQDRDHSLLMVRLFTGRHHQIRAQLALHGTAIAGDLKYGSKSPLSTNPLLFSYATRFEHPVLKEIVTIKAPFPKDDIWRGFPEPDEEALERAFAATLAP